METIHPRIIAKLRYLAARYINGTSDGRLIRLYSGIQALEDAFSTPSFRLPPMPFLDMKDAKKALLTLFDSIWNDRASIQSDAKHLALEWANHCFRTATNNGLSIPDSSPFLLEPIDPGASSEERKQHQRLQVQNTRVMAAYYRRLSHPICDEYWSSLQYRLQALEDPCAQALCNVFFAFLLEAYQHECVCPDGAECGYFKMRISHADMYASLAIGFEEKNTGTLRQYFSYVPPILQKQAISVIQQAAAN